MNRKLTFSTIAITALLSIYIFSAYGSENNCEKCRRFIESFGWKTADEVIECTEIIIPAQFDKVYANYNEIQKKSNMDLMPYRGKHGKRYTFEILNYPIDTGGERVYANIICINNSPVGGDIMTVSLNGFMHSLSENRPET